ncbi:thioredoxin-like protein [Xylaria sp. FL0933]|nr:thioredoxin-like protein [Xylaria sp. FL0933]
MSLRAATYLTFRRPAFEAFKSYNQSRSPLRQFHTTSPNMTVHNIATKAEFDQAVKKYPLVLLDCFATWCGPCKAIAPVIAKMSEDEKYKDVVHFIKIDVDELPELSQELGITAMPTFLVFKDGEPVGKTLGANPTAIQKLVAEQLA